MSNRQCRKCGEYIPYFKIIDGKRKSLQNRKFCLECSPFRGHNTKKDDPSRIANHRLPYSQRSEESKKRGRIKIYERGLKRKQELIRLAGGKCIQCGYDKNIKALVFHHKNPSEKLFGLSMNNLWSKPWEIILKEFKKCDMYCHNCHTELHDKINLNDPNHYSNLSNI